MSTTNAYRKALGIQVPRLEAVRTHPDANYYSLLIVALLERGEPITLEEAATRFGAICRVTRAGSVANPRRG